ncbi:MAG: helix-turn-helix transcriptional regulator [Clostridia bacterium]|nr:helix-turn-helix transcriptional regulator [Clostridia bacterium]
MLNFGNRLRELRVGKGWTQAELASQLRVTKSVVSAYETSMRYPSYDILIRICAIFHVSSDHLLGIEKQKTLDISGLSEENEMLVRQLVAALRKE